MYISNKSSAPLHSSVAIFLYTESLKGEESLYCDYIDLLPQNMNHMPIFYSEEELSILEGSSFLEQIEERKQDIATDYRIITDAYIEGLESLTLHRYSYFRAIVSSRLFGFTIGDKKTSALVPIVGIVQHIT